MELLRLIRTKYKNFSYFRRKKIDFVCLNELKSWHNQNLTVDQFVVTEMRASKSHGSMILAMKGTTKIEVQQEKFKKNERGKVFEILKACFEVPVLGHLWVIALYNSPVRDLNLSEIF